MVNIRRNVSLAPLTTFHIGGPAEYIIEVSGALEIAEAFEFAEKEKLPAFVLGGGSNVLFSDKGFSGVVIKLIDGGLHFDRNGRVIAGAGRTLLEVVRTTTEAGLIGMEKLAGIPGTLGGAVRGNAGAFGTQIGDLVTSVKAFHRKTGFVKEYRWKDCQFGYRTSYFKQHPEWIVISAEFDLEHGDAAVLRKIADETVAIRESKHPQTALCAGSFFTNPKVSDEAIRQEFERETGKPAKDEKLPAGFLIDHVGLRGKRIGGAMVSDIHPNYLLNTGTATAEDIVMLASVIKQKVRDELNVRLIEEVQFVGF